LPRDGYGRRLGATGTSCAIAKAGNRPPAHTHVPSQLSVLITPHVTGSLTTYGDRADLLLISAV
jgi:hypothetical protein